MSRTVASRARVEGVRRGRDVLAAVKGIARASGLVFAFVPFALGPAWTQPVSADPATASSARVLHLLPDSSRVEYFITHPISNVRNTAGVPSGEIHLAPSLLGWTVTGRVTVDLRTLETGIGMRDRHVKSEEYLDVETFPLATFEFVAVETDSPAVVMTSAVESPSDGVNAGAGVGAPDSSLEGMRARDTHLTAGRVAQSVSSPRGGPPRIDPSSLPRSWTASAAGELTLHGVTRPLQVPVEIAREGDDLRVHGTFSIFLADYQIRRPSKFLLAAGKHADVTVDLLWAP